MDRLAELEPLFFPKTIAVFGASRDETKFGSRYLRALLDFGFQGAIYPVHPSEDELLGLKAYPDLGAIPAPVDMASIMVPAPQVPGVLEQCRANGVRAAQILTSGFAETGDEGGRALEAQLRSLAGGDLRFVGPNCFGVYCPAGGLTLLPGGNFPKDPGPVAFLSQSGGHAVELAREARGRGIRFSKVVSYGNAVDLNEADLLEYVAADPETELVAMYLEGPREGIRFFRLLRELTPKKPVIIWKAGLTQAGAHAVRSHTASLAGEEALWTAALAQAGAVRVTSLEELADTVLAFRMLPPLTGTRVGVVGGGGGISVAAADACGRVGLEIPPFEEGVRAQLRSTVAAVGTSIRNPVDIGVPIVPPEPFERVMSIVAGAPNVDIVIATQALYHILSGRLAPPPEEREPFLKGLLAVPPAVRDRSGKPVVIVLPLGGDEPDMIEAERARRLIRDSYLGVGIPSYPTLERAARAVAHVAHYYAWLRTLD